MSVWDKMQPSDLICLVAVIGVTIIFAISAWRD